MRSVSWKLLAASRGIRCRSLQPAPFLSLSLKLLFPTVFVSTRARCVIFILSAIFFIRFSIDGTPCSISGQWATWSIDWVSRCAPHVNKMIPGFFSFLFHLLYFNAIIQIYPTFYAQGSAIVPFSPQFQAFRTLVAEPTRVL